MKLRRSGISSVIGSIFLILIAFLVLTTSLLVFNSFSQYASVLKKSNQTDQLIKETSLQINKVFFGGLLQPLASQTFNSIQNTKNSPFFPISNMNFTNSASGWYFTRSYYPVPPDTGKASNSPLFVPLGLSTFTLTITNSKSSQDDIAQVSINVDPSFQVPSTQPNPSGWTSSVSGNTITWTAIIGNNGRYEPNDIDPGKSLTFTWIAVATGTGTYTQFVTLSWVANDQPPFVDMGTSSITTIVGSSSGSSGQTTVRANFVFGASGANGGFDPSTAIGSSSGPGSLYLFFEPQLYGMPIQEDQSLGSVMNFTTSFTLDSSIASSISGLGFSYGFSLDQLTCESQSSCSVKGSIYLIQESTGQKYTLVSSIFQGVSIPSGWIFNTLSGSSLPSINWMPGKYDLVISVNASLKGSEPQSNNYPSLFYMHFDDVGIALKLKSTTYYVDTWAQSQSFIIRTGLSKYNISSINLDVLLGSTSGPVFAYVYLNDFSEGTISNPAWTLMNSTVFTGSADLKVNVPSTEVRLFVDQQGSIAVRIYAVSLSSFQLSVQISSIIQTSDQTKLAMQVTNLSPFAVHLVSLYVNGPTGLLHFDINSSAPGVSGLFDYWLNPGQSLSIQLNINWVQGQSYVFTIVTDNGVMTSGVFRS